jgi:hypothetical protein
MGCEISILGIEYVFRLMMELTRDTADGEGWQSVFGRAFVGQFVLRGEVAGYDVEMGAGRAFEIFGGGVCGNGIA